LKSRSERATQDPIIKVIVPNHHLRLILIIFTQLNLIKRYKPAVTKVEEWTKAEIGVGALMAAGSHLIKGNWALLVHNPIISKNQKKKLKFKVC